MSFPVLLLISLCFGAIGGIIVDKIIDKVNEGRWCYIIKQNDGTIYPQLFTSFIEAGKVAVNIPDIPGEKVLVQSYLPMNKWCSFTLTKKEEKDV